ncbi:MAG TPA: glycosyltransferase [Acidimicrobiales bacterium]|nr:glycosyltransferase [Acidimicrobiales bacterium]
MPATEERDGWQIRRVPATGVVPGTPSAVRDGRGAPTQAWWLARYLAAIRAWTARTSGLACRDADGGDGPVVWHGHDLPGLAAAVRARRRSGGEGAVVYDSHELFVEAGSAALLPPPARRLLSRYERRLAGSAAAVVTVNDSIAGELSRRLGVGAPTVVMNCPPVGTWPLLGRDESPLRALLPSPRSRAVLYHGALSPHRGVETAVEALDRLPLDVVLVVVGDGPLSGWLKAEAERRPSRLVVHPAVPLGELPRWVAGTDVGLVVFEPVNRNNCLATPNKLFECLASGVPVVASAFPEMTRVVEGTGGGVTCPPGDPAALADAVLALLDEPVPERMARRHRCRRAAEARFNWERESSKLVRLYGQVAGQPGRFLPRPDGSS